MKLNTWKKALLVGVAGLLLVPLAAACGGDDEEGGSTVKPGATATKGGDNGDNGNGGGEAREIEVVMTDNVYTPKEIKVPVNTTIKFTADNIKGTAIHNNARPQQGHRRQGLLERHDRERRGIEHLRSQVHQEGRGRFPVRLSRSGNGRKDRRRIGAANQWKARGARVHKRR